MFKRVLLLCFLVFLVACSSDEPVIEKKDSPPKDPDESPELIEETKGDEIVKFIEFSLLDEKVKVNLNMVPILNDYIEASASPEEAIQQMDIARVQHTDKKLYILSFSCNDDLCSYIMLDRSSDNQAILLADIASLVQTTSSPDDTKLLLQFERDASLPLPLTELVVIDTEKWIQLDLENETNDAELLDYTWPILNAEWSDDEHILISKPNIAELTEKSILKWQETEQSATEIMLHTEKSR